MEIMKQAKKGGEIVPWNEGEDNLREEVLRRNAKAGYTTKYGEPPFATKIMATVKWGKRKLNIWPRDKHGRLIGE